MASKDTLPKVKRERLESQQDEDLATGGDREKTEAKSAKDKEKHPHTFYFCEYGKAAVNTISCTKAGTVLEALKTSQKFTSLVSKNKGKEIVIVRKTPENADIATHFPCWLIGAEELTIKFRGNKSDPEPPEKAPIIEKKKLVTFYVERTGGENCQSKKFLKNTRKISVSYLCIYACEGETAEEALRRDGRFTEIVFQGGSELMNIKGGDSLEINLPLTEEQDGKTFRLNMRKEEKKPSQSITETDSGSQIAEQPAGPVQEQGESTPSSAKSAPANPPAQEQEQERGESTSRSARAIHEIPDSKEVAQILRSQFKDLVKHMKGREKVKGNGKVLEMLRQEFGKNTKEFLDVHRVKKWMKMSESVCHIINTSDDLMGTGFLLFDRFILTNKHLIRDLNARIYVSFHYENEHLPQKPQLPVKEVIDWAYELNEKKCLDYALLELNVSTADLPPPLLTQFGPPIQCGGVCIIGHPEGGVKRVDLCSIIDLTQVTNGHKGSVIENEILQWLNWNLSVEEKNQLIAYHTCFFHGASGSPVFDKYGQVVAMHTGGFSETGTESVVEYATPLQPILEHFLRKMAEEWRLDILRRFIEVAMTQDALHPLIAGYIQLVADSPEPMETS